MTMQILVFQESWNIISPDQVSHSQIALQLLTKPNCVRIDKLKFDYQWLIQPLGSQYKTQVLVDVNIPIQQEIQYIPGVLETLKNAWT